MKRMKLLKAFAGLAPVLSLTGCVGYNSTLFMTKSNVGLDFDTKPPTAEISVSRKEAVIAPSFENGKTPPVMASFVTRSGVGGGFQNFFLGVSQTFSGGDAAVAMSMLYTNATVTNTNLDPYDSSLALQQAPAANASRSKWRRRLFGLPEPGSSRPFIFGTDTSLGLKVAWSGVSGQVPDTVRAGFNRKEFAFAPVYFTPSNSAARPPANGGRFQIPSFLATVDSNIGGGTSSADIGSIQYFATGAAATHLTRQKLVRDAMILRSDPRAPEKAAFMQFRTAQKSQLETLNEIKAIYRGAPQAKKEAIHKAAVDLKIIAPETRPEDTLKHITLYANGDADRTAPLAALLNQIK